jgi:hypothetical protein
MGHVAKHKAIFQGFDTERGRPSMPWLHSVDSFEGEAYDRQEGMPACPVKDDEGEELLYSIRKVGGSPSIFVFPCERLAETAQ